MATSTLTLQAATAANFDTGWTQTVGNTWTSTSIVLTVTGAGSIQLTVSLRDDDSTGEVYKQVVPWSASGTLTIPLPSPLYGQIRVKGDVVAAGGTVAVAISGDLGPSVFNPTTKETTFPGAVVAPQRSVYANTTDLAAAGSASLPHGHCVMVLDDGYGEPADFYWYNSGRSDGDFPLSNNRWQRLHKRHVLFRARPRTGVANSTAETDFVANSTNGNNAGRGYFGIRARDIERHAMWRMTASFAWKVNALTDRLTMRMKKDGATQFTYTLNPNNWTGATTGQWYPGWIDLEIYFNSEVGEPAAGQTNGWYMRFRVFQYVWTTWQLVDTQEVNLFGATNIADIAFALTTQWNAANNGTNFAGNYLGFVREF